MRLTEHFTVDDLTQPASHGLPAMPFPREWIEERALPLANLLEAIRASLGGVPMRVTSGYRSPAFNEALRRAGHRVVKNSQHCLGRAADIVVPRRTPTEVYSAALDLHLRGKVRLGGLGLYAGWVHVDIRPEGLIKWIY
jgi:zinc D-Ala-D-Ala carboxypeptidase